MEALNTKNDFIIEEVQTKKSLFTLLKIFIKKQPLGSFGALIVIIMVFMAIFADYISPYDPVVASFEKMHLPPSSEFWLGSDQFGRDMLSRLIHGARTALFIGFVSAFIGGVSGLILGVASAYFGGRFDLVFQRIMDIFMAFPLIIMALAVVSIFGSGIQNVIIAITIPFIPDAQELFDQMPINKGSSLHRCCSGMVQSYSNNSFIWHQM